MKLSYRTQANAQAIAAIYNKPLDKPDWFKVIAAKNDNEESQILLFDYIGWPYNDPRDLIHALSEMGDVLVRVNSPGGDVFDGAAIFNALTSHKGTVTTRIEGLAASMASVIAMSGKKVQAYSNTMLMIHNAWTVAAVNQYEAAELSEFLAKVDNEIVMDAYKKKTKKSNKELCEMMKVTSKMTAEEAKGHGFVDEIVTGKSVKANLDLPIFANLPSEFFIGDDAEPIIRKYEKALRDVGASKSEAKSILARGLKAAADDDEAKIKADEDTRKATEDKERESVELVAELRKGFSALNGAA